MGNEGNPVARPAFQPSAFALHPRAAQLLAGALVVVAAAPFALNLAGDAQVHLAIAEAFAAGHPFQFNPGGEIVVASTSPFWTMLLALTYRLLGAWAPVALSLTAVVCWLATGYVLWRVARDRWAFRGVALWGVVILWLAHTTIVANALGGLENVASALQLLLLYWLLTGDHATFGPRRAAVAGLLLGWALLTRPDGGLFALLLVTLWLPLGLRRSGGLARLIGHVVVMALVAALVVAPWFAYQYAHTGRLLTDSSLARLYNGRMGALMLVPNLLYVHPKALLSLASAFLPLAAGFLVFGGALGVAWARPRGRRAAFYHTRFPHIAAVALVVAGFLFYTVIVGAEAFGRYFLPLFPFFFLTGVAGLAMLYYALQSRLGHPLNNPGLKASGVGRRSSVVRRRWATYLPITLVALSILFLAATSAVDYARRLGPGRFSPTTALDVIRGPAERRYYAANVPFLARAPGQRAAATDQFLADLGVAGVGDTRVAVTEVQLRYFLDPRVTVLSLDGRTSADILGYVDPISGVPDFATYFEDARPDYVHIRQWCEVGGWLASLFPSRIRDNLVCQWERQAAGLSPGDSFDWAGRAVTLVTPDVVRIDWGTP